MTGKGPMTPRPVARTSAPIAAYVNARARRNGHLVQERFPPTKGEVSHEVRWRGPWGQTSASIIKAPSVMLRMTATRPVAARVPNFADLLGQPGDDPGFGALRRAEGHDRPPKSFAFVKALATRRAREAFSRKAGGQHRNKAASHNWVIRVPVMVIPETRHCGYSQNQTQMSLLGR